MTTTQLIVVAGFLGAGKSTLLMRAAQRLQARGVRVGLITNDQGHDLVDTALAHTQQFPVVEVHGGCFCCRFPDLLVAVTTLQQQVAPDVILAEPVGSCTDVAATVLRPLQVYHAGLVTIAPLTVLYDPQRALHAFVPEVAYLHHKQLAEAEIIVLSKADTQTHTQLQQQHIQLRQRYPQHVVCTVSSHNDASIDAWLAQVQTQTAQPHPVEVDYATYATAEAALGWLNATIELHAEHAFALDSWLAGVLVQFDRVMWGHGAAIAHVKVYAQTATTHAKASVTTSGGMVTWDVIPAPAQTTHATVMLNARVGGAPELLMHALTQVLAQSPRTVTTTLVRHECFAPAPPIPTYRIEEELS